jgi:hypothetical protein
MATIIKISVRDVIIFCGMSLWLSWMVVSFCLGGDAFLGKAEGGKYFLGSHGGYTEVSRNVYTYSWIHGYVAWAGWGMAVLAAFAGYRSRKAD